MTNSYNVNTLYNAGNFKMPAVSGKNQLTYREKQLNAIKKGIWVYFFLLIFEGALRKWIVPFLATPLLIVRDPIAIWLLYKATSNDFFRTNSYIRIAWTISILAFITAMLIGHHNIFVALYGVRIIAIEFPLMFVIGRIFTKDDVIKMGKIVLWITIPMTVLVAMQFYSPQSSWVNRGVGGDEAGAGFAGALGYFRPPGTFSFTNGAVSFYGMVAAYVFYFWLDSKHINKALLLAAAACLLVAIPFSISRSLLFQVIISGIFCLAAMSSNRKLFPKIIAAVLALFVIFTLLSKTSFFQTGTEAFTERFETANDQEGGAKGVFIDRFLGGMVNAITGSDELPFFGFGIGLGTNVGSKIATGKINFLLGGEGEWGRNIAEIGIIMGLIFIFTRLQLGFKMLQYSFKLIKLKNVLPWLLSSFGFLYIVQGQWAQPTSLGFSVLIGGLILASYDNKMLANTF